MYPSFIYTELAEWVHLYFSMTSYKKPEQTFWPSLYFTFHGFSVPNNLLVKVNETISPTSLNEHLVFVFIDLFIFGCAGFSVAAMGFLYSSCGAQPSDCGSFSLLAHGLQGAWASVVGVCGPGCPAASGVFPDQGSKPCPLHW